MRGRLGHLRDRVARGSPVLQLSTKLWDDAVTKLSKDADHTPLYAAPGIKRYTVGVFADHRVDNNSIAGQTFINDPRRQRRTLDSLFFAGFAGALFTFDHPHKVLRRLDIELLRSFVADDDSFFATLTADTLSGTAGNDLFFSGQLGWQLLPAGMFACRRRFQWQ